MVPAFSTRSLLLFVAFSILTFAAGAHAEPALVQFSGIIDHFEDVTDRPCSETMQECPIRDLGFFTLGDAFTTDVVLDPDAASDPHDSPPEEFGATIYFNTVRDFEANVFRQSAPTNPYVVEFQNGATRIRDDTRRFGDLRDSLDVGYSQVLPTGVTQDDPVGGFDILEAGIANHLVAAENPSLFNSEALPQSPDSLLDARGDPFFLLRYGLEEGDGGLKEGRGSALGAVGYQSAWQSSALGLDELGLAARLTTGSPTAFSQEIRTPDGAFRLSFNALLENPEASLSILFDGTPTGLPVDVSKLPVSGLLEVKVSVRDPSLLGRDDVELAFRVDGETGSSVRLDNIEISQDGTVLADALQNGDFESGDLAGWAVSASGTGGVTMVPEPATGALLAAGLGLVAVARRRR